jgi:hypothetical protein
MHLDLICWDKNAEGHPKFNSIFDASGITCL